MDNSMISLRVDKSTLEAATMALNALADALWTGDCCWSTNAILSENPKLSPEQNAYNWIATHYDTVQAFIGVTAVLTRIIGEALVNGDLQLREKEVIA